MGSDLVTFGNHALDDATPLLINSTFAKVDTGDEEGSLESSSRKLVKDLISVDIWTIVVGNGHSSRLQAIVDTSTTVPDTALLRTRVVASAGSGRSLVGVTTRAKVEETVRSVAVRRSISTISL